MSSILLDIQDTVSKYADIISQISAVDVEVVDSDLYRVAGTGIFRDKVNQHMAQEGHVYSLVQKIVYDPGKDPVCQTCRSKTCCKEQIEISMPVRLKQQIIGVIGIVGSTQAQKQRILSDEKLYLDLLEQIADFIASKAKEVQKLREKDFLIDVLNYTMAHIEQGVLILGADDVVTTASSVAKRQLEIEDIQGKRVTITHTGDRLENQSEFRLNIEGKEFLVMGYLSPQIQPQDHDAKVLVFRNAQEVHNKYYEMTTTVHPSACENIIGSSPRTLQLKEEILKVAQSKSTVLITGESGTGKEMVATAIWNASKRKNGRFVAINCAAIPEALLESELFGYVKGAFTGADPSGRIGKFELANNGMIFLDEIGDMPLFLQSKLLRVLQERKLARIGSNQIIPLDIRVIAATNKDLKEMIRQKKFREDLYYRLNVIPLTIPPLRERREDIEELAVFFAKRYANLFEKRFWKITDSTMQILKAYRWEGNVRELENVIEFMVNMMGEDGILDEETMPRDFQEKTSLSTLEAAPVSTDGVITPLKTLESAEIRKALRLCGDSTQGKKEAAKQLGIGLATLYRKLEDLEKFSN